ncbi:uncharacterized protein LOC124202735 [Daphnia pulex]|uniref:uncharacterized protein LOC124190616 n=1 Tax=Daphnia pulex TaxID=6669 RepID=UPI001EDD7D5A|nr:uncharacterized protein LOC124190616 [Daphnia pulex]XP_046439360.1 uncharacterized protein LOC124190617 [Daphnia pulex]XP_046439361.1 uncharacterized protein LOC124190618 [Daphnia pulex]XP_046439363.1 uncharacterized protein LOC124190619 [Daphnia pulex]XP_046444024.1 uncharacterized protein LOC124194050 [Daphnia pulex]XP_046444025.1 uncharacterized protein LOC124194051 [Daphnia pulex]XP_046444026.1 uncharacterized protein LOC124194052 [Daphnia pulex]XP_046444027.1 uncharacterized protein 
MAHTNENIIRAEAIVKDCFTASLLAGDRNGIRERLSRILPAGAYPLCNLRGGYDPTQSGPSGSGYTTRHQPMRRRGAPYGARPPPSIPMAYLSAAQRDELQQLEQEKSRQILARAEAREAGSFIAQEERRLATMANINLQQAELDRQKAALQRPPSFIPGKRTAFSPGQQTSSLTPQIPLLKITIPATSTTDAESQLLASPSKDVTMKDKTSERSEELFGPSTPITVSDDVTLTK